MRNEAQERAEKELAAAQTKVEALAKIPDTDARFPSNTVLKWKITDNSQVTVAIKIGQYWWVSSQSRGVNWQTLVSMFLTRPLDYFLVATSWEDASVEPPEPPVPELVVSGGDKARWTLYDTVEDITWVRHGNTWERRG